MTAATTNNNIISSSSSSYNYQQKHSYSPSIKSPPRILYNRSVSNSPSLLVNANKLLSDRPQLIDCPRCKAHGYTEIKFVSGLFSWISFLIILIAGVFILPLFFVWVPFIIETFKDTEHRCPNCKAHIGTYRRMGK